MWVRAQLGSRETSQALLAEGEVVFLGDIPVFSDLSTQNSEMISQTEMKKKKNKKIKKRWKKKKYQEDVYLMDDFV